jgi:hypothetical protein
MFFQEASAKPENMEDSLESIQSKLKEIGEGSFNVLDTLLQIESQSTRINSVFGQNRQRIGELSDAVKNSSTQIIRLGGSYEDVGKTISEISLASRRNVVASSEEIEKMFAASKVLGESVDKISNSFMDAGMSLQGITKELDTSVNYIQSVGGNVSQIYKKILDNTEQLNRYQFEGGVQGLTKMAAQATMLRFDMSQTFKFADDLISPERAVEVASAFQRLGVTAGNLVDPFQLMNMSINDPQGLQDSLVEVSKQYTYFDEKTKSFKMNQQGVLILKEMEKQIGLSANEMSKLGLAASELDERLSQISPSIKFENEEDRQYLANIGRMGEGGEYEVKIEGVDGMKKMSELTQEEVEKLIEEQKNAQGNVVKTAEDQLSTSKTILNELIAVKNDVHNIVIGDKTLLGTNTSLLEEFKKVRTTLDENKGDLSKSVKEGMEDVIKRLAVVIRKEYESELKPFLNPKSPQEQFSNYFKSTSNPNPPKKVEDVISPAGGETMISTKENQLLKPSINDDIVAAPNLIANLRKSNLLQNNQYGVEPLTNVIGGLKSGNVSNSIKQTIEFIGSPTLTVKHEFPAEMSNLTRETKMKLADEIVNSTQLITQIRNNVTKMNGLTSLKPTNANSTTFSPNG